MNKVMVTVALVLLATPALAQTSIRGMELTPEDAARVARQCEALKARAMRSMASNTPEPPPEDPTDPAAYWADSADGVDSALARINLSSITLRDCRKSGFY